MIDSSVNPIPDPPPEKPNPVKKGRKQKDPTLSPRRRLRGKNKGKVKFPYNPHLKKNQERMRDPNYVPPGMSPVTLHLEKMIFGANPTPVIKEFFIPEKRPVGQPMLLDERQYVYKLFCEHIAKGKSRRSFWYCSDTMTATAPTIERYAKQYPQFFPPDLIEISKAKGFGRWETVVEDSALGNNPRANVASIQMIMRNRFDWDRPNAPNLENNESEMSKLAQFFVQAGINRTIGPDAIEEVPYKPPEDHIETPLPLTPPEVEIACDRLPPLDTPEPNQS